MKPFFILALLCALLGGCAGVRREVVPGEASASPDEAVSNARRYWKDRPTWNVDCSHFVMACYHSPEMDAYARRQPPSRNLAQILFRYCTDSWHRRARFDQIRPGDILIFDKTYDANRDGRIDGKDRWTHAGIVESFRQGVLTYLDASKGRKGPKIHRRAFSILPDGPNPRVARDPATGRAITGRETFDAAFGPIP